jgi:hypothetical protein
MNSATSVFLLLCILSSTSCNKGLVAHYSFKNGSADDVSGNVNDGVISGAVVTKDRLVNFSEAMLFSSEDNYIKVSRPSFLANNVGTFAAWVKFDDITHTQYVGSVGDEASIENYLSFLRLDGTDHTIGVFQRQAGGANWVKSTTQLVANEYYHLAMLSDGLQWKIYINGQEVALNVVQGSNNGKWISDLPGIDNFVIGNCIILPPYTIPFVSGTLDDVRLYNRALSPREIVKLFKTTH